MIEVNVYGSRVVGSAETELGRQLGSDTIDVGIDLSLLWRESGSPDGADPYTWAAGIAWPLIKGFASYGHAAFPGHWWPTPGETIAPETVFERSCGVLDQWAVEGGDWVVGDATTLHLPIALAYALYLDRP